MKNIELTKKDIFGVLLRKIESAAPGFGELLKQQKENFSPTKFRIAFSRVKRDLFGSQESKKSEAPLDFTEEELDILWHNGFISAPGRPLHLHARVLYLLEVAKELQEERAPSFIHELFTRSDTSEQCAILCALPLFSFPQDYLDTAVLATRGYIREVFETIALQNPYPARCFSESVFNQMILKAFFLDVPLAEVVGLPERKNPELSRMAQDFIKERSAAGRPLPDDIELIL